MRRRAGLVLAAALATAAPGAAEPVHAQLAGYDGRSPFDCVLQQAGMGVAFPDPGADPFCVEYDKTGQNITEAGIVAFLVNEPARVAAAGGKCFYYQHDHWRGSIVQDSEATETYNWDGGYFFDLARGVGGAYVESFTIANSTGDPTRFPGFPPEYAPFFGPGRGGVQFARGIPVDPRCVEKARREQVYATPGPGFGDPGDPRPRLILRARYRIGRARSADRRPARCARSAVRAVVGGEDGDRLVAVTFRVSRRSVGRIARAPWSMRIPRSRFSTRRPSELSAITVLGDGRRLVLSTPVLGC